MSDPYVSGNDPAAVKIIAEKHGFCLVRGVFTPDEVSRIENGLAAAHAQFEGAIPDLSVVPQLRWILSDARVRDIARALLGETLVYYRETNAPYESAPGPITGNPFTEYHCDARGTPEHLYDWAFDPRASAFPGYRFAVYLRNYRDYSGGLKVAPGSHLRAFTEDRRLSLEDFAMSLPLERQRIGNIKATFPKAPIELYNVPSMPGDLVIFSLRCFHSAGALRAQGDPAFAVLPLYEKPLLGIAPPGTFAPTSPGPRNALFFDFAAPSEEIDYYIKGRALLQDTVLDPAIDYRAMTLDGVVTRNDRLIVALALRLTNSAAPPATVREDAEELLRLCGSHGEFSAHHLSFDRALLAGAGTRDRIDAAMDLARDIVAKRDAVFAKQKVLKGARREAINQVRGRPRPV